MRGELTCSFLRAAASSAFTRALDAGAVALLETGTLPALAACCLVMAGGGVGSLPDVGGEDPEGCTEPSCGICQQAPMIKSTSADLPSATVMRL